MARGARRRLPLLFVLAGAAVVVGGCGGGEPVAPSPFPPRPVNIDVSRLDLCEGVTPAEADRLGIDTGVPNTATVDGMPSPACSWSSYRSGRYGYSAQIVPGRAAAAAEEPGSQVVGIDGFGAVQAAPGTNNGRGLPAFCQIVIDVADDQALRIQVDNGDPTTGGDPTAVDAVCAEAVHFASRYVTAIRA